MGCSIALCRLKRAKLCSAIFFVKSILVDADGGGDD